MMRPTPRGACARRGSISAALAAVLVAGAAAHAVASVPVSTVPAAPTVQAGATFASPNEAAAALAAAWRGGRGSAVLAVLGTDARNLVRSGDLVAEHHARQTMAASYDQHHRIEMTNDRAAVLLLGAKEWPYPIPIVKVGSLWRFDTAAGAQQIIDRRIGRNERNAVEVSRAYVAAQRDFAARDELNPGLHEYAQKFASDAGKHDGLYWPVATGGAESPMGPLAAAAEAGGYDRATAAGRAPYRGYYFRILTGQGRGARGGARSYLVDGHMTRGFALIAWPAAYRVSGVMTFFVRRDGIVYEDNLGRDTDAIARRVTTYDPALTWKIVP